MNKKWDPDRTGNVELLNSFRGVAKNAKIKYIGTAAAKSNYNQSFMDTPPVKKIIKNCR